MTRLIVIGVLLLIGATLWAGYASQGASVDADGVLHEPFQFLALGWFFVFAGGGGVLLVGMGRAITKWMIRRT